MVDVKKRTYQVIALGALGLGAYALLKNSGVLDDSKGEGSIGGTEEGDLGQDQGFRNIAADPNTIPDQPVTSITDYNYTVPASDSIIPPQNLTDPYNLVPTITPYSPSNGGQGVDSQTSGLFGTGISAGEASLGVAGLLPSAFTKYGEKVGSKSDTALKKIIPEAVTETPFVGKKLGDLYTPINTVNKPTISLLQESTEAGAKYGLKEIGKTGAKVAVGTLPFIGTAAGAEFDVAVDNRSRGTAYTANILGDVVGGVLGGVTAPFALTGVGAAVPVALTIGGQIATESLVYGVADTLGGSGRVDQKAVDNALSLQYSGTRTDNIPVNNSYTFNLTDSAKDKITVEEEKPVNNDFWNFVSATPKSVGSMYSSTATPVLSSTSKGGTTKSTQTTVTPVSSSGGSSSKDTYKAVSNSKTGTIGQWTNTAGEVTGVKFSTAPSTSTKTTTSSSKNSSSSKKTYVVIDTKSKKKIRTSSM